MPKPSCERCKSAVGVKPRSSQTAYVQPTLTSWQWLLLDGEGLGEPPDPNGDRWLCEPCAEDYDVYMTEMWSYANSW